MWVVPERRLERGWNQTESDGSGVVEEGRKGWGEAGAGHVGNSPDGVLVVGVTPLPAVAPAVLIGIFYNVPSAKKW